MRKTWLQSQVVEIKPKITIDSNTAILHHTTDMRAKQLTLEQVVALMKERQGDKPQRVFAQELGITQGYLSDIYRLNRQPGEQILEKLGLVRRIVFEQVA
jgi:hypothetical protein